MAFAQEDYQKIILESEILSEQRELRVVFPENYNLEEAYPVIYITDGSSSNFDVAKNYIESLSEYSIIPPSILVGIVHIDRNSELNVFESKSGQLFLNHLLEEVIPYIDSKYNTSGFNVMVGHSNGAEINHLILLQNQNPFRGFVSMSTSFNTDKRSELVNFFNSYRGKPMYYFVSNAKYDSPERVVAGNDIKTIAENSPNENINFELQEYSADHMNLVPRSMLDGLQFVFHDYNNIRSYKTFADYSHNYISDLKNIYGVKGQYAIKDIDPYIMDAVINKRINEFHQILDFIEKNKLWHTSFMEEPGGFDPVNKANMFFVMGDYEETI